MIRESKSQTHKYFATVVLYIFTETCSFGHLLLGTCKIAKEGSASECYQRIEVFHLLGCQLKWNSSDHLIAL